MFYRKKYKEMVEEANRLINVHLECFEKWSKIADRATDSEEYDHAYKAAHAAFGMAMVLRTLLINNGETPIRSWDGVSRTDIDRIEL